jgi:hypothetical protein
VEESLAFDVVSGAGPASARQPQCISLMGLSAEVTNRDMRGNKRRGRSAS